MTADLVTYADLVAEAIVERQQKRVYLFPGGTIAPVIEALDRRKMPLIVTRHEQGAGYAALAEARLLGKAQAVLVSSGPGVTNIVTPVADAWCDSIPLVIMTGQVGVADMRRDPEHRQKGFQEIDTAGLFAPISKAVLVARDPEQLPEMLDKAFSLAESGRMGPVVLDLPMSTQRAALPDDFAPSTVSRTHNTGRPVPSTVSDFAQEVSNALLAARRPILLIGNGAAQAQNLVRDLYQDMPMPYSQSLPALGILPTNAPDSLGYHGHTGNQAAGLAIQQSDFCLVLGSRLDLRQTGTETDQFAPQAKIFRIEVDPVEIQERRITSGKILEADLRDFLPILLTQLQSHDRKALQTQLDPWRAQIMNWKAEHILPVGPADQLTVQRIVASIDQHTQNQNVTLVTGVGSHQQWAARHFSFDNPTRQFLTSAGLGAMGYDLPAAIGAAFADPERLIVCIVGDGSIQMNLQELSTIGEHQLNIKIFCVDNKRHGIVSQFQKLNWQDDPACGDKKNPDFAKIAEACGLKGAVLSQPDQLQTVITKALAHEGPVLVHAHVDPDQDISPMLLPTQTLDQMYHI